MINQNLVLKYMNGNLNLFRRVAKSFVESYEDFSKMAFNLEDKELYRNIHSQKGVSLNLGLEDIYKKSSIICDELRCGIRSEKEIIDYLNLLDIAINDLKEATK